MLFLRNTCAHGPDENDTYNTGLQRKYHSGNQKGLNIVEMKRLILGLGNEILTDDGIGLKIVSDLQKTNTEPGLDFRTSALGGLELLDIIRDYDEVIIVDAMKTGQVPPGTVQTLSRRISGTHCTFQICMILVFSPPLNLESAQDWKFRAASALSVWK